MSKTSFIKKNSDFSRSPLVNCHGGEGAIDFTEILDLRDEPERKLKFMHDDILEPGVSVGVHEHTDDEEYYYILSGTGVMTLDQENIRVEKGDIVGVFPGGSHGIINDSDEDLRMLVVSIKVR